MELIDIYTTEFPNSDRDELLHCIVKATRSPLELDLLRWKMGMMTCESVMSKHGFSRAALNRRLLEYKERNVAYLLSQKSEARANEAEFKGEVRAMNDWLAQQEPNPKS